MKHLKVIVIGSGISGLYTALKLEQNIGKVMLITKSILGESNSYYAQGGMVAVLKENKNDSVASHIEDTLNAGAGLSEEITTRFISENSDNVVKDLLTFGVDFDRDENGKFKLTKESAHSVRRILHSGGDATGREVEISLCKAVKNNKNIELLENTTVVKLITEKDICKGVEILQGNEHKIIYANVVILATGGLGQIYKYTTNPIGATGDGFALAYNAGAVLRDMEFVQFHPTALAIDDLQKNNRFLISEAVRGEGAKLCNKDGIEYMAKYDIRKELAPRDVVARANFSQMKETNQPSVYLDATKIENVENRFPTITKKCREYGIDITKDLIPVAPASHYFMGGIKTDLNGETSIKNLYAIGEVASTGLHGANRLASNSLLECVVCAYKSAEVVSKKDFPISDKEDFSYINNSKTDSSEDCLNKKLSLQSLMWDNVGIFRSQESLEIALKGVEALEFDNPQTKEEYELKNMLTVSKLIILSALNRKESRGAHYRTDYLQTDEIAKHSEISKEKTYAE